MCLKLYQKVPLTYPTFHVKKTKFHQEMCNRFQPYTKYSKMYQEAYYVNIVLKYVTIVTGRVPHVERENAYHSGRLSSSRFQWVCIARSLVFCVMFCRSQFILLSLFLLLLFLSIDLKCQLFFILKLKHNLLHICLLHLFTDS